MKQTIIAVICFLCVSSLYIQAQKINHPSLLYTPQRIQQVKQRMQHEPKLQEAWGDIKKTADKALQKKDFNRLDYLSLAYLMTDNKEYADAIKEILLKAVEAESWGDVEMMARIPAWRSQLGMAHKSFLSAVGYDAAYNVMSSSERKKIAEGLKRLAVEPALGDWLLEPTRIHSLNSMGHNWWTSCVCQGGILALSLQNELPEVKEWVEQLHESLPEWFDFAGDVLQQKAKSFDEAGGMYESLNYANFGIQEALLFRIAWINTHPGQNPGDIPQLAKLPSYFSQVCYPRTGMLHSLNFGDSHKNVSAESSMMLLYALGVKDPTILWYIAQVEQGQHRDGFFLNRPMGFLYTPDLSKAPAVPQLPTSQLFADFGWATMRNSWEKDATMLAVKSGHTWNHSHADANSFIVFHKGVDIIKDGGNCWYPNPAYRNYFFQSQAHNVVLFNGEGQPREQQYSGSTLRGYLHHLLDAGNVKYVLANGTGPVSNNFSRNFRHFLWMDNVIYMIDVAYFYLRGLDFYGGMPIYRRSTTEESPRSTARETFNYVEELLLAAIPKLEKKTADMLEEGYLRQGTAAALLAQLYFNAEVYTGESRFAECAQICQDLLDGKYGYYELEEDWFGPFTFENNKSKEVMWSVQSQYAKGTLFQWQFERYNHYNAKNYFDLSGYSSTNGMHLQPSLKPNGDPYTDKLGRPFAKFHAKDLRKKLYVYKGNGKYEGMFLYGKLQRISRSGTEVKCTGLYEYPGEVLEFVDQVAQFKKVKDGEYSSVNELPSNISTGEENSGIRLCKLPVPDNTDKTLAFNPDYPVLRFAEIYYMLAECKYRSGYKKEAANLFNEVRKRNFENEVDPDPVTETNIDKYRILDEWMVEFLGEQRRRTDLRRWGLYTTGTWWDHRPTNDDHYELFPIPEKSISVSNVLRQNPGYGGGNEMTKEEAGIYSVKQID